MNKPAFSFDDFNKLISTPSAVMRNDGSIKIGDARSRQVFSAESIKKSADKRRGLRFSQEVKDGMSIAQTGVSRGKGKKQSVEHIEKRTPLRECTVGDGSTIWPTQRALAKDLGWGVVVNPEYKFRYISYVPNQKGKCTVDNVTIYDSKNKLACVLGRGVLGLKHPNFRFI